MNTQPIEKRARYLDNIGLDIVDIFPTIQGEGPFCGQRAIFIRLAGCNLQCPKCDTDYTSYRKNYTERNVLHMIKQFAKPPYLIVITGGEPFRQDITKLIDNLLSLGFAVQIESNGTLKPKGDISPNAIIVCSPKTTKISNHILNRADFFKYVLSANNVDEKDGLPIKVLGHEVKGRVARPSKNNKVPIYIQPADNFDFKQNRLNLKAAIDSCLKYGYLLQLQIHKIIGLR